MPGEIKPVYRNGNKTRARAQRISGKRDVKSRGKKGGNTTAKGGGNERAQRESCSDLTYRRKPAHDFKTLDDASSLFTPGGLIKDCKILSKESASPTVLLHATTETGEDIIMKIHSSSLKKDNNLVYNELLYETRVYEYLSTNKLPFVVQHIKTFDDCDLEKIIDDADSKFKDTLAQMKSDLYKISETRKNSNANKCNILVLEKGTGTTLHDFSKHRKSLDSWVVVMMQIIYCLVQLSELRITHYDLHLGNVLIDECDPYETITLQVSRELAVSFRTRYIVKIFDFDHAFVDHPEYKNELLTDLCDLVGECNTFTSGWDISQLFANTVLDGVNVPSEIKDFIYEVSNEEFMIHHKNNNVAFQGHPCIKTNDPNKCEVIENLPDPKNVLAQFMRKFPMTQIHITSSLI